MRKINFAKVKQRIKNGLVAALFVAAQVGAVSVPFLNASVAHAAPVCTVDTAGANDEPGQKDLNKLCVDYAGVPTTVSTTWNWDETGTSGANTMDACNLFDTDGDGNVNYSVCVTTTGDPATFATLTTYSCGDAKGDRCTSAVTVVSSGTTSCGVTPVTNDPFAGPPNSAKGDDYPKDTQGNCTVQLSTVGGATAKLIDVCSYPSEQPNSDPSDCVIAQPKAGKLEVVKDLVPNADNGLFNLQIDGTTKASNVGDNGTTGEVVVPEGNHSVGETQGTNTTLTNYTATISCKDLNGTGSVVASGPGTSLANVPVADGSDIVCTITNTRKSGTITVNKVLSPSNDPGLFNLQINGSTAGTGANVSNGGTTGAVSLNPGNYTIGETAGTNTSLSDYTATWSCTDNGSALASGSGSTSTSLSLASDHSIVCTITNTRNTGSVQVSKLLDDDGNGSFETVNPSSFNWSLDGSGTNAMGSTVSNVNTGTHSVNENSVTYYHSVGWYVNDGVHNCSNLSGTTFPFNVSVTTGQTASVTICNARDTGTLRVFKNVDLNGDGDYTDAGETGATNWTWTANGGTSHNTGDAAVTVTTGDYTLAESGPSDFHFVDLSCTGGALVGSTVTVNKDANVVCTYVNARDTGIVSFLKTVIGGTSVAGDWTFNISDGTTAQSGDSATYMTGSYTVTESGPSGYTLTSASGICSLNLGVVTMLVTTSGGQCELTNTRDTGSVKVNKLLDNDGDGTYETTNPGTFNWSLDGSGTNAMGSSVTGVETGSHNVNENTVANYHLVSWYYTADNTKSCANPNSTTLPASVSVTKDTNTEITICNARDTGTITVNKIVNPSSDDGLFNLQIDGSTAGTGGNVGDGGTTGTITLPTGTHSVSEVAGDNTNLDDYLSRFECSNGQSGNKDEQLLPSTFSSNLFTLSANENVTCTFTNVRKATITVVKDAQPNDPQDFSFTLDEQLDNSEVALSSLGFNKSFTLDDDSDPTLSNTEVTTGLTPGAYVIHEDETVGWTLDNVSCGRGVEFEQEGTDILVLVAPGADITCTFTNTRDTGTVTVNKVVTPSTDTGKFNLQINGVTYAANIGDGGTTGAVEVPTGDFTADETAGTDTSLDAYEASYNCVDEEGILASGTGSSLSLTLSKSQNIVCTFTNNKGEVLGATAPTPLVNTGNNILATTIASLTLISTVAGLALASRRHTTSK